jgi:hypothetical protein
MEKEDISIEIEKGSHELHHDVEANMLLDDSAASKKAAVEEGQQQTKPTVRKKHVKKVFRKPKDMPKRPLSGSLYFRC